MSKNNLNGAKYRRADNGQYTTERYAYFLYFTNFKVLTNSPFEEINKK
jgi:hypothetical protein